MGTVYLQKDQWQLRNYFRNKAILSAFQNTGKSIQILSSSSASSSLQLSKKKKECFTSREFIWFISSTEANLV